MIGAFTIRLARLLAGLATGIAMTTSVAFADGTSLGLPQNPEAAVTLAHPEGLAGDPSEILQVFVGNADECCDDTTPVAGRYAFEGNILSFTPAFGFSAAQDYIVLIRSAQGDERIPFRLASDVDIVPAAVTEVYPSGDVMPENTLRFYIHFSVPMRPHVAFDYIRLSDASGNVDEAAFMQFSQELWNEDRTRLTVLIDPGRIKREVATNLELGPALLAGQRYTLSVEGGWPSADGASVLPVFERSFLVSGALRTRPDVSLWTVNAPCAGTRDPLTVSFDRPFDRHLLAHALRLETGDALGIDGTIQIEDMERTWSFTPQQPWPLGDLRLVGNPILEDVAGNNFRDLLDHVAGTQEIDPSSTNLPISIRGCSG